MNEIELLRKQRLREHQHEDYTVDVQLPKNLLKKFIVNKGVFRPEISSGIPLASHLSLHPELYMGKSVIDLCCGTGIQGIVMGLNGARQITFSDISRRAKKNAEENVNKYGLSKISKVVQGDLYENIKEPVEVIICNHPFVPFKPSIKHLITRAWCNEGELIQRLLKETSRYLLPRGILIMPFLDFLGDTNNPLVQGLSARYNAERLHTEKMEFDKFESNFNIYKLTK